MSVKTEDGGVIYKSDLDGEGSKQIITIKETPTVLIIGEKNKHNILTFKMYIHQLIKNESGIYIY